MMRQLGIKMKIKVNREQLLTELKKNRAQHMTVFEEAKVGYRERALAALRARLDELMSGKLTSLQFNLAPPQCNVSAYDTVIQMLEWSKDASIEMDASEFRMLVQDEWDWADAWLLSNATYSPTARALTIEKGIAPG